VKDRDRTAATIERVRNTLACGALIAHLKDRKIVAVGYRGNDLAITVDGGKVILFSSVIESSNHTRIDFEISMPQTQPAVVLPETPPTP